MPRHTEEFFCSGRGVCTPGVGADANIGPLGSYEFAADFRKNGAICRGDVGIGPYKSLADCQNTGAGGQLRK